MQPFLRFPNGPPPATVRGGFRGKADHWRLCGRESNERAVSCDVLDTIKRALANDRSAEYLPGLTLDVGDDLPRDLRAGGAGIARAAELGDPDAARNIASRLCNGQSVQVNETKIADALKPHPLGGPKAYQTMQRFLRIVPFTKAYLAIRSLA